MHARECEKFSGYKPWLFTINDCNVSGNTKQPS